MHFGWMRKFEKDQWNVAKWDDNAKKKIQIELDETFNNNVNFVEHKNTQ